MKPSNKIIIGLAVAAGLLTYIRYDAWALELAHRNAGREADCQLKKLDDQQWAICRYGSGGSIWTSHEKGWAAANGEALERVRAGARNSNRGGAVLYAKGARHYQVPDRIAELLRP
jgi:hypothetical protein